MSKRTKLSKPTRREVSRRSKQETRSRSRRASKNTPSHASLPQRSQSAYDRALHAIAAMRRDPDLTLSKAAKLEGVKFATVRKYFSSSLNWSGGRFRAKKSDRHTATLYIPDAHGGSVAVEIRFAADVVKSVQQKTSRAAGRIEHKVFAFGVQHLNREGDQFTRSKVLTKIAFKEASHEFFECNSLCVQLGAF